MIIGLTGDKRAGKDTVAALLSEPEMGGYHRYSFADPMRDALLALNPIVQDDSRASVMRLRHALEAHGGWEGIKSSSYASEVRRLQERFGTDAGRDVHGEDLWVHALERRILTDRRTVLWADVAIPDVRFDNEAEWVLNNEGAIIKVVRPGTTKTTHVSSAGIHPTLVSYVIHNNGTIADLRNSLVEILRDMGLKAA